MSARKATPASQARRFTKAERAILDPLAASCIVAAVRQSKTEAAYERWINSPDTGNALKTARLGRAAEEAQGETCAAGKAFDRALRKIQGRRA